MGWESNPFNTRVQRHGDKGTDTHTHDAVVTVDRASEQELHGVFLEGQSRPEGTGVSTATAACVESTLRTLLERRKPTLAQALARFLQVTLGPAETLTLWREEATSSESPR